MNWLDILIVIVGAGAAFLGWKIGVLRVVISVVAVAAGIFLASHLNDEVARALEDSIASDRARNAAAFVIVFGVVVVLGLVASLLIRRILELLVLGWVDRVGGLALGIVITLAGFSALLSALQAYPVFDMDKTIAASTLGSIAADNFDAVLRALKLIPRGFGK